MANIAQIEMGMILQRVNSILDKVTEIQMHMPDYPPAPEKRQLNFKDFSEAYGIPVETLYDWKDKERGFAGKVAFKHNSKWYIDLRAFEKWRAAKHEASYKYA